MNARTLRTALAISVGLNLFAVAAGAVAYVGGVRADREVRAERQGGGRHHAFWNALQSRAPEVRDQVHEALKASALEARVDFRQARSIREQAIEGAAAPSMDASEIKALLARSRAAEFRGRERLESNSVDILNGLEAADRQALSVLLARDSRRCPPARRDDGPASSAEPAPDAPPDAASNTAA